MRRSVASELPAKTTLMFCFRASRLARRLPSASRPSLADAFTRLSGCVSDFASLPRPEGSRARTSAARIAEAGLLLASLQVDRNISCTPRRRYEVLLQECGFAHPALGEQCASRRKSDVEDPKIPIRELRTCEPRTNSCICIFAVLTAEHHLEFIGQSAPS